MMGVAIAKAPIFFPIFFPFLLLINWTVTTSECERHITSVGATIRNNIAWFIRRCAFSNRGFWAQKKSSVLKSFGEQLYEPLRAPAQPEAHTHTKSHQLGSSRNWLVSWTTVCWGRLLSIRLNSSCRQLSNIYLLANSPVQSKANLGVMLFQNGWSQAMCS